LWFFLVLFVISLVTHLARRWQGLGREVNAAMWRPASAEIFISLSRGGGRPIFVALTHNQRQKQKQSGVKNLPTFAIFAATKFQMAINSEGVGRPTLSQEEDFMADDMEKKNQQGNQVGQGQQAASLDSRVASPARTRRRRRAGSERRRRPEP